MNRNVNSLLAMALGLATVSTVVANPPTPAPTVSRLTPPSQLFSVGDPNLPVVARFLPGQRFDLQATIKAGGTATITNAWFSVDGSPVVSTNPVTLLTPTASGFTPGSKIATLRAYSNLTPGIHTLTVNAQQNDGSSVSASGNFEVVGITASGRKAKNIIVCLGDGMGIAHRTAARLVAKGSNLGKSNGKLNMDTMPFTGLVETASLNSIVTDSAPGMACYANGNKSANSQEGVFPDDTTDVFDNPRVEYAGEYLHRTQGASLGIVTTADVFDATPAATTIHTANRGAGTGIIDQYIDEAVPNGLTVLMGGGRKWFLPSYTNGVKQATSVRAVSSDYALPTELATAWNVATGFKGDTNRDVIADFVASGFTYAPDNTTLAAIPANTTKLLGIFSFSNMNVAKDKLDGPNRRNVNGPNGVPVVNDYLLPDQPMLDDMTGKALQVLSKNPNGFFLMVEGASIDKQAHLMDSDRWILEAIEFDKAVGRALDFAKTNIDTLVIVTADHECGGINIIGASTQTKAQRDVLLANNSGATQVVTNYVLASGTNKPVLFTNNIGTALRDRVVGTYDSAGFPVYPKSPTDGYPVTMDVDQKIIIGYAGGADRFENFTTAPTPLQDSQQPLVSVAPLNTYPANAAFRGTANGYFISGQVPPDQAVHTASDIPVSAYGRGAAAFTGVMDNTDVFFKAMQAALGGATRP
jgi:alkaline phosphatase